jgi:hypothetical protein
MNILQDNKDFLALIRDSYAINKVNLELKLSAADASRYCGRWTKSMPARRCMASRHKEILQIPFK